MQPTPFEDTVRTNGTRGLSRPDVTLDMGVAEGPTLPVLADRIGEPAAVTEPVTDSAGNAAFYVAETASEFNVEDSVVR